MISFDVVSLFTSIPLDTAKQITNDLLTNDCSWQTKTALHKDDILDLLDLCLHTEFSFQNNYYRQISGTPMGSPLSSFLAEAVMQDLEKRSVTNNTNIRTWDRYVDDVLATVKKDKTEDILHTTRRLQRRSLRLPTRSKSAQTEHLCTTAQVEADPGIFVCRSKFPGLKVGRGSLLENMALKPSA